MRRSEETRPIDVKDASAFGATLLASNDPDVVLGNLYQGLKKFISIKNLVLLTYQADVTPEIHFMTDDTGSVESRTLFYLTGPYLLDPFYHICKTRGNNGIYFVRDIAGPRFQASEYYRSFFMKLGLEDEINIVRWTDDKHMTALSIGRPTGLDHFGTQARKRLEVLEPLIQSAIQTCWQSYRQQVDRNQIEKAAFHKILETALDEFGSSVMTVRERLILRMLLSGHSLKSTADRLEITEGTVRLHRHNIYEKLDVRSQTEVFSLLLDSLRLASSGGGDPLVRLLQKVDRTG